MPTLIDRNGVRRDEWLRPDAAAGGQGAAPPSGASVLLPLAEWTGARDRWLGHDGRLGVLFGPADDPFAIESDLAQFGLLAVEFPSFTDGRGYSTARLLRERLGWSGELRAVGAVLRDQLFLLARCGFDTFELRDDQDLEASLAAFGDFSETYQAGVDRTALFERRHAGRR
jgi:uncharacterized protein (DUF934 family)